MKHSLCRLLLQEDLPKRIGQGAQANAQANIEPQPSLGGCPSIWQAHEGFRFPLGNGPGRYLWVRGPLGFDFQQSFALQTSWEHQILQEYVLH